MHNTLIATSQEVKIVSKVFLFDGSILIGTILEANQNDNMYFELSEGTLLNIPVRSIKKIIQNNDKGRSKINNPYEFREKGFYNVNYLSSNAGIESDGSHVLGFGLSSVVGKMFCKYFGVGLGVGFDKYDFINLNNSDRFSHNPNSAAPFTSIYQVFLETRGYLFSEHTSYYYSMNVGYGLPNRNKDFNVLASNGGLLLHPAIGIRLGGKKHFNVCIDLGLKFQQTSFTAPTFFIEGIDHYNINYKRFILRVGMQI